jgi:hypothetical protein
MLKKFLPVLFASLLLTGCTTTFTNLTPQRQVRTTNNLYQVEVALSTRQATLLWSSIKPQIIVGKEAYPMRATMLLTNRWEGLIPVPAGTSLVHYRYKFDYEDRAFGNPRPDSATSPQYSLQILEQ